MKRELLFTTLAVLPGWLAAKLLPLMVLKGLCGAAICLLLVMLFQNYRHGRN